MTSDNTRYGFRAVHPDFRSRNGYVWPFPGQTAEASGPFNTDNRGGCPSSKGDGICLATTAAGAASGGIPLITVLVCSYDIADLLGSEQDDAKVRVRKAKVLSVHDFPATMCRGTDAATSEHLPTKEDLRGANLFRANLAGADLAGAYLSEANLNGASLNGANLSRADLAGASLYGADLSGASLNGANLYGANLSGASLYGADLSRASLNGASLNGADLSRANLAGAYLSRADLAGVIADGWTLLPASHAVRSGKVVPA